MPNVTITDTSGNTYQASTNSPQYRTAQLAGYQISGGNSGGSSGGSSGGNSGGSSNGQYDLSNPSGINWSTAYGGRFSHLANNPTRAAQLAAQYEAANQPTGGWNADLSNIDKPSGYENWTPEYQSIWDMMSGSLDSLVQSGQMINPSIEITPQVANQFLNQATAELSPYYNEQVNFLKQDLADQVKEAERTFKESKNVLSETAAEGGFGFSGYRGKKEVELGEATQRAFKMIGTAAERTLGSSALSGFNFGSVNTPTSDLSGNQNMPLYTLSEGLMGSLNKEKQTNIRNRASQLEWNYRANRALDFY